jgi:hypothetical protein
MSSRHDRLSQNDSKVRLTTFGSRFAVGRRLHGFEEYAEAGKIWTFAEAQATTWLYHDTIVWRSSSEGIGEP